ncbi:MAG: DinB family protein [Bacteroidota bacterium]
MKNFKVYLFLFVAPAFGLSQPKQPLWTEMERQNLVNNLKLTQKELISAVENLSNKQIHFKPKADQWSVAEVLEHIAVYEELLYWDLSNNQFTDERPDLVEKVKGIDSAMVAYEADPNKGQAPFAALPMGRFNNKTDLINFFNRFRNEVTQLVLDTQTDFRLHFIFRPSDWGIWHIRDLHQYTLLWIAHTKRHLNQIQRIKGNLKFPKS